MTNDNLDDFDDDLDELEFSELKVDDLKIKLPNYTSQKLCEMIVCDRYFGCYKEIAVICMEELSRRRTAGDAFDFETFIENAYSELPVLDFSVPDLSDVLRQFVGRKINK